MSGLGLEMGIVDRGAWEEETLGQNPWAWAGFLPEERMGEGVSDEGIARAEAQKLEEEVSGKNSEKLSLDTTA